jgi:hypothetical protein
MIAKPKHYAIGKHLRQFGVLIVAGAIIIVGIAIQAFQFYDDFPLNNRIQLSSGQEAQELYLEEGEYVFFYEYEYKKYGGSALQLSIVDRLDNVSDYVELIVYKLPEKEELLVYPETALTYSLDGIAGESLLRFNVADEGKYSVLLGVDSYLADSKAKFSIAADFSDSIVQLMKHLALVFVLAAPCVLLGLYIYWQEERRKKHIRHSSVNYEGDGK